MSSDSYEPSIGSAHSNLLASLLLWGCCDFRGALLGVILKSKSKSKSNPDWLTPLEWKEWRKMLRVTQSEGR